MRSCLEYLWKALYLYLIRHYEHFTFNVATLLFVWFFDYCSLVAFQRYGIKPIFC